MSVDPIPREILDANYRRLCHRILSCFGEALARSNMSVEGVAAKLGKKPEYIYGWIRMFAAASKDASLEMISDFLFACDCELDFQLVKTAPLPAAADEGG